MSIKKKNSSLQLHSLGQRPSGSLSGSPTPFFIVLLFHLILRRSVRPKKTLFWEPSKRPSLNPFTHSHKRLFYKPRTLVLMKRTSCAASLGRCRFPIVTSHMSLSFTGKLVFVKVMREAVYSKPSFQSSGFPDALTLWWLTIELATRDATFNLPSRKTALMLHLLVLEILSGEWQDHKRFQRLHSFGPGMKTVLDKQLLSSENEASPASPSA